MSTHPTGFEAGQPSYTARQCWQTYQATNDEYWRQRGLAMPGTDENNREMQYLPQRDYISKRRFTQQPSITFKPIGPGPLRLKDLVENNVGPIHGGDDCVFPVSGDNASQKQSIRLEIIGEGVRPFERQINVRNPANNARSITRAKLAEKVAKEIYDYVKRNHVPLGHPSLRIGPGIEGFDRLVLLELRHVSKSSWQPIIGILPL